MDVLLFILQFLLGIPARWGHQAQPIPVRSFGPLGRRVVDPQPMAIWIPWFGWLTFRPHTAWRTLPPPLGGHAAPGGSAPRPAATRGAARQVRAHRMRT